MRKSCLILLFVSWFSFSQENTIDTDYTAIDNKSRSIKYKHDLNQLTLALTAECKTQIEKTRAIFIWITDNIKYDCRKFNKMQKKGSIKTFRCKTKEECDLKKAEYENKQINRTLNREKGVCGDYSMLFQKMCRIAGINCYYINGYTKSEAFQVGKMGDLDHAWNVAVIDGVYYYFDLTWAAGGCTRNEKGKLTKFYKHLDDYYWMTPIDKLSRNHYPKDTTWIKNSIYTKKLYKNNPFIDNSIISKIDTLSPNTGVIEAKVGDTIKFLINFRKEVDKVQINSNSRRSPSVWKKVNNKEVFNDEVLAKQKYTDYSKDGDKISFYYVIDNKPISFVEILFDYRLAIKYRIKINK